MVRNIDKANKFGVQSPGAGHIHLLRQLQRTQLRLSPKKVQKTHTGSWAQEIPFAEIQKSSASQNTRQHACNLQILANLIKKLRQLLNVHN